LFRFCSELRFSMGDLPDEMDGVMSDGGFVASVGLDSPGAELPHGLGSANIQGARIWP
jgi:hypothetical protein